MEFFDIISSFFGFCSGIHFSRASSLIFLFGSLFWSMQSNSDFFKL